MMQFHHRIFAVKASAKILKVQIFLLRSYGETHGIFIWYGRCGGAVSIGISDIGRSYVKYSQSIIKMLKNHKRPFFIDRIK